MSYWIVVVDDEPLSLTNAKNLLRAKNMRTTCLRSGSELLEFMENHSPDLILLDILMPKMDGFETYRALRLFEERNSRPRIPVIFLTGEDNHESERRGLRAGASDFVHKPFDEDVLIKRINNTIANSKMIEILTEEATQDKLTGFLNKASGTERIAAMCKNTVGALTIMDLDSFKLVNDLYGHDMGDRVLVAFAEVIRHNIRTGDLICRIGGDEFLGFFADMTEEMSVASLTRRLNEQLAGEADRLMGADHGIPLGISIGVARTSDCAGDYQILFQDADSALYEVKRNGKHGYSIFNPERSIGGEEEDPDQCLSHVIQIVSERGEGKGALLLGQEAFSWNYRFIERILERTGGVAARILFTLSSAEKGMIFSEMISEFGSVLKHSLRRSDIIFQWQQNRFFVVLPLLSDNNPDSVIARIMQEWDKTAYRDRMRIRYAASLLRKDGYDSKE